MNEKNFELNLSDYKRRTQVSYEEYQDFIRWYMKKCNIRVLKVKDRVSNRTVIDKKTKEQVSQTIIKGYGVGYLIFDNFYEQYIKEKQAEATPVIWVVNTR